MCVQKFQELPLGNIISENMELMCEIGINASDYSMSTFATIPLNYRLTSRTKPVFEMCVHIRQRGNSATCDC